MHIIPAAITKPISKGVKRVWEWICSETKEERGVTTSQQNWAFTRTTYPQTTRLPPPSPRQHSQLCAPPLRALVMILALLIKGIF